MKVETIDRLIYEDMTASGKTMAEILECIPRRRRDNFRKNVEGRKPWYEKLKQKLKIRSHEHHS